MTTISIQWPLPPPALLEHYEHVLPGAAERILSLAELQAGHRRRLEAVVIESDASRATRGQLMAFVLALTTVLGGFVLVASGRPIEGLTSVIVATASLVTTFVVSKRAETREQERKRTELGSIPEGVE